jgi:hypothetical protein
MNTLYATQNIQFSYVISSSLFIDSDNQALTLSVYQNPLTSLPSWLTFNSATNILYGIPSTSNVGTLTLQIFATDPFG